MKILWKKGWIRRGLLIQILKKQMEKQEMVNWKKIRFVCLHRYFHCSLKLYYWLKQHSLFLFFPPLFSSSWPTFFAIYVQKRSVDGSKQGTTPKKLKKDKVVGATSKANRSESVAASGAPRVKPELALPVMYILEWPCGVVLYFYNVFLVSMIDVNTIILEIHII